MASRSDIVHTSFASDPYAKAQGFELVGASDNTVVVSMTVREDQVNFLGGTHGGALFSLADCAFSLASNAYGDPAVAIDTHLVITAPSDVGEILTATAHEMTRGRSLATYRVDVTREDGRTVALFTGTVFLKRASPFQGGQARSASDEGGGSREAKGATDE
jgi:acyl-CoA thioesterase